jgi:hypothetical protein
MHDNLDYTIVDFQYFGNINYIKKLLQSTNVFFNVSEFFAKSDFSNRCRILGGNGPITLSVPLKKGRNQKAAYREVKISNAEKWQLRHWRSLVSSYNGSPWFHHYKDELAGLYSERFESLIDWDLASLRWIVEKLKLPVAISVIDEMPAISQGNIRDLRKRTNVDEGAGSCNAVSYNQVFMEKTGFIPNLSILDLLFCEGPRRSVELLR